MASRVEGGSIAGLLDGLPDFIQKATVTIAQQERARAIGEGMDPKQVTVTDNVRDRSPQNVKPFGKIVFVAQPSMVDAVLWALAQLVETSPIGPGRAGHYKDDHTVMINGVAVQGNLRVALSNIGPNDRVQIVNPRIYARRLEGGTASARTGRARRKALSRQAPNGIYRVVQRLVVQRYSKSLFVDFKYVKLNTGAKVWGDVGGGRVRINGKWVQRQRRGRAQRDQVYPALQFFIKQTAGEGT